MPDHQASVDLVLPVLHLLSGDLGDEAAQAAAWSGEEVRQLSGGMLLLRGHCGIKSSLLCCSLAESHSPQVRGGMVTPVKDHTWAGGMVKENKF